MQINKSVYHRKKGQGYSNAKPIIHLLDKCSLNAHTWGYASKYVKNAWSLKTDCLTTLFPVKLGLKLVAGPWASTTEATAKFVIELMNQEKEL